ncbi:MAG: AAA family ATPase [Proteobacteria bacterium]|nr:AAA family ATPase [Pseudomonadota bacterium]
MQLRTHIDGVYIVPATRDLVGAPVELVEEDESKERLAKALASSTADVILLDCPPSLNLLTVNALVAAHSVLIPLKADKYPLRGLGELVSLISHIRWQFNPALRREGLLLTMWNPGERASRLMEEETRSIFGDEVFDCAVPFNARLYEGLFSEVIVDVEPDSSASKAYVSVAWQMRGNWSPGQLRVAI